MEGTISLGIYDHTGKLVRILHREASAAEFVAALDGFITHWDGLDDSGNPLPPGHYSASGYMVGSVTVRKDDIGPQWQTGYAPGTSPPSLQSSTQTDIIESGFGFKFPNGKPFVPQAKIRVGLVSNPLDRDRAGSAEVSVAFDAKGSWLQLADGLPLKQISATPNLKWIALGRSAPGEPLVVFQSRVLPKQISSQPGIDGFVASFDGDNVPEEFVITKVANMMAFDCGDFDLPAPSN